MRTRTLLATALVGVVAVGSATPSFAAKPKPKPMTQTYTATAYPDPTSTNPATNEICAPTLPTAIFKHEFVIPAAGTLEVALKNKLDWSIAIREGSESLASSDGGTPDVVESTSISFKKKTKVSIDTCNFAGEPNVEVTATFTYK